MEFIEFTIKKLKADFDNIIDSPRLRTVRDIASTNHTDDKLREWASSVGTYFGRYRLEKAIAPDVGHASIHKSSGSVIRFATDMTVSITKAHINDLNSADESGRYVAIKLIHDREQFERERKMLLCKSRTYIATNEDVEISSNRFDPQKVVRLLRYHDEEDEYERPVTCLVMPRAGRSLDEILRYENYLTHKTSTTQINFMDQVKNLARNIVEALESIHTGHSIVHGNLKPKNIVRVGRNQHFRLIDMSSSVKVGDRIGLQQEHYSTGFCPPELAKTLFAVNNKITITIKEIRELEKRQQKFRNDLVAMENMNISSDILEHCRRKIESIQSQIDLHAVVQCPNSKTKNKGPAALPPSSYPKAHPTYDVWSFGVLMYAALTGSSLFSCDHNDNITCDDEKIELIQWSGLREKYKVHMKCVLQAAVASSACDHENVTDGDSFNSYNIGSLSQYDDLQIGDAIEMVRKCLEADSENRPQSMSDILSLPFFLSKVDRCTELEVSDGIEKSDAKTPYLRNIVEKGTREDFSPTSVIELFPAPKTPYQSRKS